MNNRNKYNKGLILTLILCFLSVIPFGCSLSETTDPNNPSTDEILNNASVASLNNVVVGSESGLRDALEFYLDDVSVVGREIYRFAGSEPRYTQDLLGQGNATLDNNAFYTTRPWNASYRVVKNCNLLLAALNNTNAPTDAQKQGYRGFANTIKAYELLLALNITYTNGIRIDVADPNALGPIVPYDDALTAIANLLNEANTQLTGAEFAFRSTLAPDITFFQKMNRALAARVAVYRKDYSGALAALNASFFDLNGDFRIGSYYIFSNLAGDQLNRFFYAANSTGEIRPAHPAYVSNAIAAGEGNDARMAKVSLRAPVAQGGLSSNYDAIVYKTNTDPLPVIRNEELILIYAEANIGLGNFPNAITAINRIRVANNLLPYAGAIDAPSLTNEMLKQRRYSLFDEGHRWIDMRRYNKLSELPIDRNGDDVWSAFPIPFAENVGQ